MKITLEEFRKMDESKMADSDHPFREDITSEEFLELINESARQVRDIKPLNPRTNEAHEKWKEEVLKAMNSSKDSY